MVAYSYGCILTLEALALLEKDGYTADVILIDGAADMLKPVIRQQIGEAEDLAIFETNVLCAIISQFKTIEVVAKQRVIAKIKKSFFFTITVFRNRFWLVKTLKRDWIWLSQMFQ